MAERDPDPASMALREHVSAGGLLVPARDCTAGVDTAIARLIHDVQEAGFVRSMVHAGRLMVIVDGLNEVAADTREKIASFAREMSKGDVLISTQPIEWQAPPGARILDLIPLDRVESERFLLSRPIGSDQNQTRHGAAYAEAVATFLRRSLDEAPTAEDRRAAELMLSNPFDLTFAADLLAQGYMPFATTLVDEAFRLADEGTRGQPGYRAVAGQPFPLVRFGRHAVAMRLEDRNWFKPDEFAGELTCPSRSQIGRSPLGEGNCRQGRRANPVPPRPRLGLLHCRSATRSPTTTSPVATPTRLCSGTCALIAVTARISSRPARTARSASSSWAWG
jgi:hypothetical protein